MKIKFIKEPSDKSLEVGQIFEIGKVYDLSINSATRWINRGVAEISETTLKKVKTKKAE